MDSSKSNDIFQQQGPAQYGMLKTLTLLTFIGCSLAYIGLIYNAATWGDYEKQLRDAMDAADKLRDSNMGSFAEGTVEMLKKSHEYRYILAATGLVFTTLCLVGAMQMRKLKKSGFPMYVIGELAPLAVSGILIGFSFFGSIVMAISAIIAIVFVILYATQRKYLIY